MESAAPALPFFGLASTPLIAVASCSSIPRPRPGVPPEDSFVVVPGPPPPARPEILAQRPEGPVVWIDGAWNWEGSRWRWTDGGWFTPAPGTRYADWATKRRPDGELLYANPQWLDARGTPTPAPPRTAAATPVGGMPPPEKP